jgi:hypothetical protein
MITIDPSSEPDIAATVHTLRDFKKSGRQGELKIYVREGAVRPVVEERVTFDMVEKYLK